MTLPLECSMTSWIRGFAWLVPLCLLAVACEPEPSLEAAEAPSEVGTTSAAITLPPSYADALVTAVSQPTALAFTPDGRLLITTQGGQLRVFAGGVLVATPALNLAARLCTNSERGLLGIAVDPDFSSTGHLYLYYTFNKFNTCTTNITNVAVNRVSRFTLSTGNVVNPASELVVLDNIPSTAGNHNGGDLHFGADGLLYVSVGDGGCQLGDPSRCAGQNTTARRLDVLLGKMLRIRKDGTIPTDNPWYAASGSRRCGNPAGVPTGTGPCQENYATGLRNPFRFAFQPGTNTFFINDVGQGVWEEIDEGIKGADYGWNTREGHCANNSTTSCGAPPAGMTNPLFDYKHGTNPTGSPFQGCNSITGGTFAPPGAWASSDDNAYFFSDYVCGKVFRLTRGSGGAVTVDAFATGLGGSSAVTLRFGPAGTGQSLYYTTYAGGGEVRRIDFTGTRNRAPTAALSASPTAGATPLTVNFNGGASSDPDGDALTYVWNFGDGSAGVETTAATTSHVYTASGAFTASLSVRDARGATPAQAATLRIDAGNTAPVPVITGPLESLRFYAGQPLVLTGSATDAEDGTLPATQLTWRALLHHNEHTHPLLAATSGNNIPLTAPQPEDLPAVLTNFVEVQLTATDSQGRTTTVSRNLLPHIVDVALDSVPSGLTLEVNGTSFTTPTIIKSWERYTLNVAAPSQTDSSGVWKVWASWSDGGALAHGYLTPASNSSLSATYQNGFAARVDFLPATSAAPSGYVADTGLTFGDRGNGLSYGWNTDNSTQTRARGSAASPDARYDTFTHLQKTENPNAVWELAVPSGQYRVTIAAGDPDHVDSVFSLALEGQPALSGTPNATTHFFTTTTTVNVSDGRLTLTNGSGAANNKVNFVDVEQQ
ncbi:PKD domain-containing protein [Myxococcus llanfairpwllgwyngyllgogerychwyrndrobwllllantysiliogogogochensis]|uniref:PKD domain-containing protein n=2 Tax=Myxococcus llanfairpwllgwyngyllgogerychwyrndrobwllllantysiliogogogochensis TaxID=2590453 RepID=A0A540WXU6_9BACT|nr:PKD domain-containing protein [Myxococcus llanfairpwllgwyngyllgogerychwyrndrobwllllantysiliogogogochensis]